MDCGVLTELAEYIAADSNPTQSYRGRETMEYNDAFHCKHVRLQRSSSSLRESVYSLVELPAERLPFVDRKEATTRSQFGSVFSDKGLFLLRWQLASPA